MSGKFKKVFLVTFLVTIGAWSLAYVFSAIAGESQANAIRRVSKQLNAHELLDKSDMIDLTGVEFIHIESGSTDIDLQATATGPNAEVEYHGPKREGEAFTWLRDGNKINLMLGKSKEDHFKWNFEFDDEANGKYVLRVRLPKEFAGKIFVDATSADLDARNLQLAELKINATSGDLEISDSKIARAKYSATSGDAEIKDFEGDLEITVTSGDVEIERFKGNELRVRTTSGDVKLDAPSSERVTGDSTSGDFDIKLSDGAEWSYDLSTRGSINNDFGGTQGKSKRLQLRATSGDFTIKR